MVHGEWNSAVPQHKTEQYNYISSILHVVEQEFPTGCHKSNKMQYGQQFVIMNSSATYQTLAVLQF